ncbi:MAG: hypothetical protein WA821_18260 [Anaerolineales bacterium]
MSKKTIEKNLKKALLENGPLAQALFEHDLEEHIAEFKLSRHEDKNVYFFVIAAHSNDIAMLLIDKDDHLHVNEDARALLKTLWQDHYRTNIQRLIPDMAGELEAGYLYTAGVKITNNPILKALTALRDKFWKKGIGRGR